MNSLLNMKIVGGKPEISELKETIVVDEETQEEDPNFIYEEDDSQTNLGANLKEVITQVRTRTRKETFIKCCEETTHRERSYI